MACVALVALHVGNDLNTHTSLDPHVPLRAMHEQPCTLSDYSCQGCSSWL